MSIALLLALTACHSSQATRAESRPPEHSQADVAAAEANADPTNDSHDVAGSVPETAQRKAPADGHRGRAVAALVAAVKSSPTNAAPWWALAASYEEEGDFASMAQVLDEASCHLGEEHERAKWLWRGRLFLSMGRFEDSETHLRAALGVVGRDERDYQSRLEHADILHLLSMSFLQRDPPLVQEGRQVLKGFVVIACTGEKGMGQNPDYEALSPRHSGCREAMALLDRLDHGCQRDCITQPIARSEVTLPSARPCDGRIVLPPP
jgi:hypothetical protein